MSESMAKEIKGIFAQYGHHCHVTPRDDDTVILSDCTCVNFTELEFMLQRFKCDDILVQECSSSKTGFIILLSMSVKKPFYTSALFCQFFIILQICILAFVTHLTNFRTWMQIERI